MDIKEEASEPKPELTLESLVEYARQHTKYECIGHFQVTTHELQKLAKRANIPYKPNTYRLAEHYLTPEVLKPWLDSPEWLAVGKLDFSRRTLVETARKFGLKFVWDNQRSVSSGGAVGTDSRSITGSAAGDSAAAPIDVDDSPPPKKRGKHPKLDESSGSSSNDDRKVRFFVTFHRDGESPLAFFVKLSKGDCKVVSLVKESSKLANVDKEKVRLFYSGADGTFGAVNDDFMIVVLKSGCPNPLQLVVDFNEKEKHPAETSPSQDLNEKEKHPAETSLPQDLNEKEKHPAETSPPPQKEGKRKRQESPDPSSDDAKRVIFFVKYQRKEQLPLSFYISLAEENCNVVSLIKQSARAVNGRKHDITLFHSEGFGEVDEAYMKKAKPGGSYSLLLYKW